MMGTNIFLIGKKESERVNYYDTEQIWNDGSLVLSWTAAANSSEMFCVLYIYQQRAKNVKPQYL